MSLIGSPTGSPTGSSTGSLTGSSTATGGRVSALEAIFKALASERRLQILDWLKDPEANFPPQEHGDPVEHGACNLFIVDRLGVSQPAATRHLKVLVDAGLVIATRRKGWTYYRRDDAAIAAAVAAMAEI